MSHVDATDTNASATHAAPTPTTRTVHTRASSSPVTLLDLEPRTDTFLDEALAGLRKPSGQRTLPCKFFYDRRGSQLFDQICELPEYYPTRTEVEIMRLHAPAMGAACCPGAVIVEFGSGSSLKTRLLLERLQRPAACVPVDISREHLLEAAELLADQFPAIEILPVCADFTQPFPVPTSRAPAERKVVYFPGSTIGNFTPAQARPLLARIAELAGPRGGLLIGIDLKKDRAVLEAAYNDAAGVTAAFNLNLLVRMNQELGADFDTDSFYHRAVYDEQRGRIEMRLISRKPQRAHIGGERFEFAEGEVIVTEYSHKYTIAEFAALAREVGFELQHAWTDSRELFAVLYLSQSARAGA